jgi:hypothetical protein
MRLWAERRMNASGVDSQDEAGRTCGPPLESRASSSALLQIAGREVAAGKLVVAPTCPLCNQIRPNRIRHPARPTAANAVIEENSNETPGSNEYRF